MRIDQEMARIERNYPWHTHEETRAFRVGFTVGWNARTANTDSVMVTREYLADLEQRVSIREGRAFLPDRPDGSVS